MELWAMQIDGVLDAAAEQALLERLPAEQQRRLEQIRNRERRQESLWAWSLLRFALGGETLPETARTELGKPRFPARPELHFSLSHTDGAVLAGLSDRPIGVDVERLRPVGERLLRRLACREEAAFFRLWVRREARAKRLGTGIGTMLDREPPLEPDEYYHPLDLFPGYVAGVACGEAEAPRLRIAEAARLLESVDFSRELR